MARFSDNQKLQLGKRIKFIRQSKGLDQKEFGEKIQPPAAASNVSRWERGISIPNSERINSIASLANVSANFLLNGTQMSIKDVDDFQKQISSKSYLTKRDIQKATEISIEYKMSITHATTILNKSAHEALKDNFFYNLSASQREFINDVIYFLKTTNFDKQSDELLSKLSIFFNNLAALIDGNIDRKEFKQYENMLSDTIDKLF